MAVTAEARSTGVSIADRDTGHRLCDLAPRRHMTADWRSENDNIHLIQWIVVEYGSSRLDNKRDAIRLNVTWAALPMPPVADMTKGVNDPISTSRTLWSYPLCFSRLCLLYVASMLFRLLDEAYGFKTHTSKYANWFCHPRSHRPWYLDGIQVACWPWPMSSSLLSSPAGLVPLPHRGIPPRWAWLWCHGCCCVSVKGSHHDCN